MLFSKEPWDISAEDKQSSVGWEKSGPLSHPEHLPSPAHFRKQLPTLSSADGGREIQPSLNHQGSLAMF